MSFSSDTKNELCKTDIQKMLPSHMKAEYYGMLLFGKKFSQREMIFRTEHSRTVERFTDITAELCPVIIDKVISKSKRGDGLLYRLNIPDAGDRKRISDLFGYSEGSVSLHINRANFDDEDCSADFLRGAFLSCGTVTDPKAGYHLEFSVQYMNLAYDLCRLISEIHYLELEPKIVVRRGNYIVYIKGSEHIADLLAYMGAGLAAMQLMQEKIIKDVRNTANRKANSDFYNTNKSVTAGAKQRRAIMLIDKKIGINNLPEELAEIANLRLENPDMSLKMLAEATNPPISRSGVNHRIAKLMEIADELEKKSPETKNETR